MKGMQVLSFVIGVLGMVFCLLGLLVEVHVSSFDYIGSSTFLGKPLNIALKMILLELGAIAMLLAASMEKRRLYQILEFTMVLYGIVFFLPMPEEAKLVFRVLISAAVFSTLWKMGLLSGSLNKVAAVGLDTLCYGQLVDSNTAFFFGSLALAGYSTVMVRKNGAWIDKLWLCLNCSFGLVAGACWAIELSSSLGIVPTIELFLSIPIIAFIAIVLFVGEKMPWIRLAYVQKDISGTWGPTWSVPFQAVHGGHISHAPVLAYNAMFSRLGNIQIIRSRIQEFGWTKEKLEGHVDLDELELEYQRISLALIQIEEFTRDWVRRTFPGESYKHMPVPSNKMRPICPNSTRFCCDERGHVGCWDNHIKSDGLGDINFHHLLEQTLS